MSTYTYIMLTVSVRLSEALRSLSRCIEGRQGPRQ
jgi:hypothetical protein